MPRVGKAVIMAKGGYFEESDLFNTFLVTTWFHVLFYSCDVFNNILQSREYQQYILKNIHEYVCPTFSGTVHTVNSENIQTH